MLLNGLWERLGEVCVEYTKKTLEESFYDAFPDADLENLNLNSTQRIVLVGFSIEASLERMIEWLSGTYAVTINAIVLTYAKTRGGDEILMRTSIISEAMEQERSRKQKKFEIPMSDDPGAYDQDTLRKLLVNYLGRDTITITRLREIVLPALLRSKVVTRDQMKKAFVAVDPNYDESKVGYYLTRIIAARNEKE